jgi:hypothetical protein
MKHQSTPEPTASMPSWETLEDFARQGVQQLLQRVLEEEVQHLLGRRRSQRRSMRFNCCSSCHISSRETPWMPSKPAQGRSSYEPISVGAKVRIVSGFRRAPCTEGLAQKTRPAVGELSALAKFLHGEHAASTAVFRLLAALQGRICPMEGRICPLALWAL